MSKSIKLLSKSNITSGKLKKIMPEFYDLKKVKENNHWHNNENVFDHTLAVLSALEKIINGLNKNIKQALGRKMDKNSRITLLKVATLLHDIAKPSTIIYKNGATFCPNHEEKGAVLSKKLLKRFNISRQEAEHIVNVVKYHGDFHHIFPITSRSFQRDYGKLRKRFFNNIYVELLLLTYADTVGSYLKIARPQQYRSRVNFYKKELKNLRYNSYATQT